MKSSKELKDIYNQRFSQDLKNYESSNHTAKLIIKRLIKFLKRQNFNAHYGISLDVGCASGHFTNALELTGLISFGLDISDVAIEKARITYPNCTFINDDGFKPRLESLTFDLIFMKGFSGTNTHDLSWISNMCNNYIKQLRKDGYFILSFSTNYSGKEINNETVNWTKDEINKFITMINLKFVAIKYFSHNYLHRLIRQILGKKQHFYIIFQKQ